ncbi:MAG: PAS domain-containing sensor histidine kinase, partial [Pseudomonadota bacterium]
ALALGLKAYDDRTRSLASTEGLLHREAVAVNADISGRLDAAAMLLQTGTSSQRLQELNPDIELTSSLADALTAPEGSRLLVAGEAASLARAQAHGIALSSQNDIVVVAPDNRAADLFAIIPLNQLVPTQSQSRRFALLPQSTQPSTPQHTMTACALLGSTGLSSCVTAPRPAFGREEALSLLIYAFLLAGPALGLAGLISLLQRNEERTYEIQTQATQTGRMLATVLREAKAGFWSIDVDHERIWLSPECAELIGAENSGWRDLTELSHLFHSDQSEELTIAISQFAREGELEMTLSNPDQSRWFDMRGHYEPSSRELAGVMLDVTDIRRAIARSRQAERRLEAALEGFSGPFALWDSRKRLIYWNHAFARVFNLENTIRTGMTHATITLAQTAGIVDRRPHDTEDGVNTVRVATGDWYKLVERETPSGGMITMGLDVSSSVRNEVELMAQQKKLRKLVLELERSEGHAGELAAKLNEEKIRAENSSNSKSAFLANMSHELRTPLNAINGFSEILSNEMYGPLGDERYREYSRDILTSGQHLLDMINDILDMAKIEAGKMTVDLRPIELIDPVDAAVRMIRRKAEEKGIRLTLVTNEDVPPVEADHRAIRQMILNLVSNAIKFTDEGGEIRVSIDRKEDEVRVAVRDNGIGIPEDALPRLAEPFEQVSDTRDRNYEGTGLGLAL